jgi:hopanoid biosynthesis associated radical SAM protein HpnH
MTLDLARYLLPRQGWPRKGRLFPIVLMLEPLEACNLCCSGCGRVREYRDHIADRLSVDRCLAVAEEAGAPVVSLSGGEPLLHPGIADIAHGLVAQGRWVFLCTNGLLLRGSLARFRPVKRLCFVVHLDGTQAVHDGLTGQEGTYDEAVAAIREARRQGFRVATNTTVFRGSDPADLAVLFRELADLGVEGLMVSPGYAYEHVEERDLFLQREEAVQTFRRILAARDGLPFYDNPLFLDFLRGERSYPCAAWAVPTYTVLGWRSPCYLIADAHVPELAAVLDPALWQRYGPGRDPRCAGCMIHAGFEPASVFDALNHPWKLVRRNLFTAETQRTSASELNPNPSSTTKNTKTRRSLGGRFHDPSASREPRTNQWSGGFLCAPCVSLRALVVNRRVECLLQDFSAALRWIRGTLSKYVWRKR